MGGARGGAVLFASGKYLDLGTKISKNIRVSAAGIGRAGARGGAVLFASALTHILVPKARYFRT